MGRLIARARERYLTWRYGLIDRDAPIGLQGEQLAARLLRRKGLLILAHGETDRGGEIDLIALDKKRRVVVFVEVKTLQTTRPGHPAERVDHDKQARITRAALRYLKRNKILGARCRFDVIAIWWPSGCEQPQRVEHYENAFEAVGDYQMY